MYTKAYTSLIRQKFLASFGMYMSPVPSATLEKVNWVNYKTGIKGIFFKMDVDNETASVVVEIFLKNTMLQHRYFEIFNSFANQFKTIAGEDWSFYHNAVFDKGAVSLMKVELNNVNVFREDQWPTIISFLKQYIIELDAFWAAYKPAFEIL